MTTDSKNKDESTNRKSLFGSSKNGLMPIKPFEWTLSQGNLLEIPVTTIPMLRLPFHLSYIIWLSKFSKTLALNYFRTAIALCKRFHVTPSFLLHPVDFLGRDDINQIPFFPGMDLLSEHKISVATEVLKILNEEFNVVTMGTHAKGIREAGALKKYTI